MSDEQLSQSDINIRLALAWLLNPDAAPLSSYTDDVQRLISALSSKLPTSGLDAETEARIDAFEREGAVLREAQRIVAYEEAKTLAKKMLAEKNGKGASWAPVDIAEVWETVESETQTDVGYLSGDMPLGIFYRGKINGVHAESEAGKSWLACLVAVQEIMAGRHVAYIDFEDDAAAIIRRLKMLGASREDITHFFHYCNPTGPLTDAEESEFQRLVSLDGSLAIFDGMTEAMALEGLDGIKAEDVAAWHSKMTKPFAAAQWAVVVLDHVPHDGKRAIGSQHKKSALTGVSYLLDPVHPIGKGATGKSRLRVEKDRPAWVRAHAVPGKTPQHFADLVIDFKEKPMPIAKLWPARPADDKGYRAEPPEKLRTAVLGFVQHNPGASKSAIRRGVTGGNAEIDWALEWLIDHAQVIIKSVGQANKHYPADPAGTLP
ncbi:hypothetical protein [Streptomyces sp. MB09-02B]|uniref:hypothetical protein n=1 Tax=Streptomyces sp. MB09-02B TaxID=3028667 RepID=UPI0029AC68D3|nr:hypothetical protein [Streptomyces sp. MB09-02B]MDX3640714.1 hypothetical protein [Streptomyces sp. MB09-02B]